MITGSQDSWTFRIVDSGHRGRCPGVPVSVVEAGGRAGGYWVSDADGVVRIPKHDRARLRLRVGLAQRRGYRARRALAPRRPHPLTAPRDRQSSAANVRESLPNSHPLPKHRPRRGTRRRSGASLCPRRGSAAGSGHHIFARRTRRRSPGVDRAPRRALWRMLELEQVWQSLDPKRARRSTACRSARGKRCSLWSPTAAGERSPTRANGTSRSSPRCRLASARRQHGRGAARPRHRVGSRGRGERDRSTPRERTAHERGAPPPPHRHYRARGRQAGRHVVARCAICVRRACSLITSWSRERYRVIVRSPRLLPALLVPSGCPTSQPARSCAASVTRCAGTCSIAHSVRTSTKCCRPRGGAVARGGDRVYAHIAAHLAYYSATIIAAGDPAERFFALAKLHDPQGRPLTDVIENVSWDEWQLRRVSAPLNRVHNAEWRAALTAAATAAPIVRAGQEQTVTLPVPGIWLRSELFPAEVARATDDAAVQDSPSREGWGSARTADARAAAPPATRHDALGPKPPAHAVDGTRQARSRSVSSEQSRVDRSLPREPDLRAGRPRVGQAHVERSAGF